MLDSLPAISLDELSGFDAQDTLVLTVNNRHARRVLAELSASLGGDRRVIAVPDIVPLSAWLRQLSDQLSFLPDSGMASHPIDAFGARLLWQRVIERAESDRVLLDVAQAATLAMEADRLMDDWRIEVGSGQETGDYLRFREWRAGYRQALAELDLEDANQAYETVHAAMRDGRLRSSARQVVLGGFTELSPRLATMLAALQQQGCTLWVLRPSSAALHATHRVVAQDPDTEWRLAAHWAAEQLRNNPSGRYAIIASRLEAEAPLAHRCLRAALGTDAQGRHVPYNVAVARPLSGWPLIRAALAWLRVLALINRGRPCPPEDLGRALLAGGCAGHTEEAAGRAVIDAYWREQTVLAVPTADFAALLEWHAPRLFQAWQACIAGLDGDTAPAGLDIWSQRFRRYLQCLGFPGRGMLDSHAFQVLEALDAVLDRMSAQSVVAGKLGFGAAVGLLGRLIDETPFQPQRDPSARIDVLGFLESEGGRWDSVWILGLTDEVLPAVPRPNPFLPLPALRQANAPRATPERELQWARGMFRALQECAPQVWVSHAGQEGERELRPSPFIARLGVQPFSLPDAGAGACVLESLRDDQGPALQPGQPTRGGIAVIDTQARNPLWAFARYRLGARRLSAYADVTDQNARGIFLHRAMELVWRVLPDQAALLRLEDESDVDGFLQDILEQAAADCLSDYGPALRRLESARALSVLASWLDIERARVPFTVRDVEQDYPWSHGPLSLNLRLDRIDELDGGKLAVIDYKTGGGSVDPRSDWMRDRPIGLQLPFYASVLAQEGAGVAALVLARLHAKGPEVKGLADIDCGLNGLVSQRDWPAFAELEWGGLMARWRQTIHQLAQEYISGHAANQSLRADDIDYCDILPFLRLNEDYRRVQ